MIEKHIDNLIKDFFPFSTFYDNQFEIIKQIVMTYLSKKKYFILESPPGTGKSVIAYTASKVISQLADDSGYPPNVALTKTIALQKQYEESFDDASVLWSAKRYDCLIDTSGETHYGSIYCKRTKCAQYASCPYVQAKEQFYSNKNLGVLNYAYFLVSGQVNPNVLVLDEAHTVEEYLCEWFSFAIRFNTIDRILNELELVEGIEKSVGISLRRLTLSIINCKESRDIFPHLKPFVDDLLKVNAALTKYLGICIKEFDRTQDPSYKVAMKKYSDRLSQVAKMIQRCHGLEEKEITWIISEQEDNDFITCKPLQVDKYSQFFFGRAKFVILMSGTICGVDEYARSLGLKSSEYEWMSLDSVVPVENRPIYSLGLKGLNHNNKFATLLEYMKTIDGIIEQYAGRRGIIHSTSYENAEYVMKHTRHKSRIYLPTTDEVKDVAKLIAAAKDRVIVSPAILEGIDLPGDLCEFQIFMKLPYGYLGDQWIATKLEMSRDWYSRLAVIKIVQGAGRGVRSSTDSSATFILDSNFNRLVRGSKHLFPQWFLDAIIQPDVD